MHVARHVANTCSPRSLSRHDTSRSTGGVRYARGKQLMHHLALAGEGIIHCPVGDRAELFARGPDGECCARSYLAAPGAIVQYLANESSTNAHANPIGEDNVEMAFNKSYEYPLKVLEGHICAETREPHLPREPLCSIDVESRTPRCPCT